MPEIFDALTSTAASGGASHDPLQRQTTGEFTKESPAAYRRIVVSLRKYSREENFQTCVSRLSVYYHKTKLRVAEKKGER